MNAVHEPKVAAEIPATTFGSLPPRLQIDITLPQAEYEFFVVRVAEAKPLLKPVHHRQEYDLNNRNGDRRRSQA
jgi:hypothetical protein